MQNGLERVGYEPALSGVGLTPRHMSTSCNCALPGFVAAILSLFGSGCHLLVGDFEIEEAACADGTFSCAGVTLQQCSNRTWVPLQECNRADLCAAEEGRCRECSAGDFRCQGQLLEQCNATLDGWDTNQQCDPALLCDADAGRCVTCKSRTARCTTDGAAVETCVGESGWTSDNCGTLGCVDEPGDCDYCRDCAPEGRLVCSPCGKVLRCEGAQWRAVEDCLVVDQCVTSGSSWYCMPAE